MQRKRKRKEERFGSLKVQSYIFIPKIHRAPMRSYTYGCDQNKETAQTERDACRAKRTGFRN